MNRSWKTRALTGASGVVLALGIAAVMGSAREPLATRADIHSEYVKYTSGRDTITAYLAYPERADPAPAVIVIHDIYGMSDRLRPAVDLLAQRGFVAIGPDLLSRRGGTSAVADSARRFIMSLHPDTVTQDLDATYAYLRTIKAVRPDRIGVIGFCWGGGQSFRYATNNPGLRAFVVCYGPGPDTAALGRIKAKGFGVYAENDARINTGLTDLTAALQRARVDYQHRVYPGVGHAFLQTREKPEVADSAWSAIERFFREQLDR
ncbi:MAG: dienelactone hydrolase family protein [Gemmatimonadales bacterium]